MLKGQSLQASLTVKDLTKSVKWYLEVFGFQEDRRIERDGKLRGVAISAGEVRIILNQDDGGRGWTRVKGEGFSLYVPIQQDIDELARGIRERGGVFETEPQDMPWGARIFRLRDPDNYKWVVSAPLTK
ncbi:MAG TPA: VOC family protein [Gemmatimonadales bacterium]|nr:VOC family protein [Gemmatimonadales bacterium]